MMKVAKDYNEIKWTVEDVFGTKMKVSEPLAMASAAGWYIGQLCKEDDFPMLSIGLRNMSKKMHLNY